MADNTFGGKCNMRTHDSRESEDDFGDNTAKMSPELKQTLDAMKLQFQMQHAREMEPSDVPFHDRYCRGAVDVDEPPGISERYYQLWLYLGGKPDAPRVVTADDL